MIVQKDGPLPDNWGAPKGSRNKAKAMEWTAHLKHVLANYTDFESGIERGQALRKIAEVVVKQALAGEWRAIEEIGNRIEGKPAQSIDLKAEVIHRAEELTDAELTSIALGSREGTVAPQTGETIN